MRPELDIVIPCYGDVDLVKTSIRSVLGQSDGSWQLILLDDGMPGAPLRQWVSALGDPRVRYVRNEVNLGVNGSFAAALALTSREYVVFMGADDVMLPGYVAQLRDALRRFPGATVVQPGVQVVDSQGRPSRGLADRVKEATRPRLREMTLLEGEKLVASLMQGNWTYFPSLCWRRDAVVSFGFRPGLEVALDLALLVDVLRAGGSLLVDPEPAFCYRRHDASYSSTVAVSGHRFAEERALFGQLADECQAHGWPHAARAARLHLTSRLHAASLLPETLRARNLPITAALVRHVLAGPERSPQGVS